MRYTNRDKSELAIKSVIRILRKAGAVRVGEDAAYDLRQILEERGIKIAGDAIVYSKHAQRKTVKGSDIKIAYKHPPYSSQKW